MAYQEGTGGTFEEALNDAIQKAKTGTGESDTPIQWKLIEVKGQSSGTDSFSVRIDFHFSRIPPQQ